MSWRDPAWDALDIEPTSDTRAIRVAYARKLKAIDVEADPTAFVALREAFERAQAMAQWVDEEEDEEDEDEDWADGAPGESSLPAVIGDAALDPTDAYYGVHTLGEPNEAARPPMPRVETGPSWDSAGDEVDPESGLRMPTATRHDADLADRDGPSETDRPQPWRGITPEEADRNAGALVMLLRELCDPESGLVGTDQTERMLAHWHVMAADPRMQELSYYGDAERWFSELIASFIPASDPLVRPASTLFGWVANARSIAQTPAVARVVERERALIFFDRVRHPKHPLNSAWRELVRPAVERSRRGFVSRSNINSLLAIVRRDYPDLEDCFDSYRVSLWESKNAQGGWLQGMGIGGVILAVLLFRLVAGIGSLASGDDHAPSVIPVPIAASALDDQDSDIHSVLENVGDGTLAWKDVEMRNPKLAQLLKSNWGIAHEEAKPRRAFVENMRRLLHERYRNLVERAPYPIIADYRRVAMDKAKALRALNPAFCGDYFEGKDFPASRIPDSIRERELALVSRTLLETTVEPAASQGDGRFLISAAVHKRVARRAGLSETRLQAALTGKGTPAEHCNARIALAEIALELPPKEGVKLLREM